MQGAGYAKRGLRFRVRDVKGTRASRSSTTAACPTSSSSTATSIVDGRYVHGTFVAKPNTLVTKCPSKYVNKKS